MGVFGQQAGGRRSAAHGRASRPQGACSARQRQEGDKTRERAQRRSWAHLVGAPVVRAPAVLLGGLLEPVAIA